MREIFVFRKDTGGCLGILLFKSVRAWHCSAMRCNWTKKSVHQWYTKCLHQWYRKSKKDLKPTGFQFPLGKFGDGSDSWHYQHRKRRQFWCPQLCCLGSSWRELLGVQRHTDKGTNPKTWIWGFFHWLNSFYPQPQGWCSWIPALRQVPRCKPAGNLGNFWRTKRGLLGFFFLNPYYCYLIVHLLWYWASQLGSGADPPRPRAGPEPTPATASSRKASPPGRL